MNEPDPETLEAQLAVQRRTLTHLLEQAASASAGQHPADIASAIDAARAEVERLKAMLRERGVVVADEANDAAPRAAGGDVVMGDQRTITTQGGDEAEGDIDRRQVAVEGGTIYGNIIGHYHVPPSPPSVTKSLRTGGSGSRRRCARATWTDDRRRTGAARLLLPTQGILFEHIREAQAPQHTEMC